MKETFKKNRPFLTFIVKFFFTYFFLVALYQFFLSRYDGDDLETDAITHMVSRHTGAILTFFDYDTGLGPCPDEPCVVVSNGGRPVVRIVEGCNAVSVMILFSAFIVAFSGSAVRTSTYVIAGILALYALNIARIVLLVMGILRFPEYGPLLHGVVFPSLLYGFMFLLWVLWINKIRGSAGKHVDDADSVGNI